jgi:hypothetical protein
MFSPGAVDYIFRCSAGIPRNINNLCDNAHAERLCVRRTVISRAMIEEVAATFDMLPREASRRASDPEDSVRIFNAEARAELWAAGNGSDGHANGNGQIVPPVNHAQDTESSPERPTNGDSFSLVSAPGT